MTILPKYRVSVSPINTMSIQTDLTGSKNTPYLPDYRFVAAQIRGSVKYETHIVSVEISLIAFFIIQLDGKANDLVFSRSASDEASTKWTRGYHIPRDVLELEQMTRGRGRPDEGGAKGIARVGEMGVAR